MNKSFAALEISGNKNLEEEEEEEEAVNPMRLDGSTNAGLDCLLTWP
jgi:hypothetical protein